MFASWKRASAFWGFSSFAPCVRMKRVFACHSRILRMNGEAIAYPTPPRSGQVYQLVSRYRSHVHFSIPRLSEQRRFDDIADDVAHRQVALLDPLRVRRRHLQAQIDERPQLAALLVGEPDGQRPQLLRPLDR